MKKNFVFAGGVLAGLCSATVAVAVVWSPVPYTGACFQLDASARVWCHRAMDVATFRHELLNVMSDPVRLTKEGHAFVWGLKVMIDAGISAQEIGIDPEGLKSLVDQTKIHYFGNTV